MIGNTPPNLRRNRRLAQYGLVALLLLVVTFVVMPMIGGPIWTDEQRTLFYVGAAPRYGPTSILETWERLAINRWQAPAYYTMLWGWGHLAGWSVFSMRYPSLLLGLLVIALTFRLAKRYFSLPVALFAIFLMSFGAYFVHFMHDMRTYMLYLTATLLCGLAYGAVVTGQKITPLHWASLTLSTALVMYSHYFGIFFLVTLGLYHLLFQRQNKSFWTVLGLFVVAAVLFSPWVGVLINGVGAARNDTRAVVNKSFFEGASGVLYFFSNGNIALVIGLLLIGMWKLPRNAGLLWFILTVSFGLLWGTTRIWEVFTEFKYVFFYWPLLAILAALGLQELQRRWSYAWLLLPVWFVMFVGSLMSVTEQLRIQPWSAPPLDTFAGGVASYSRADDAILFHTGELVLSATDEMLKYYLDAAGVLYRHARIVQDRNAMPDSQYRLQIMEGIQQSASVWVGYENSQRTWRMGPVQQEILPDLGFVSCGVVRDDGTIHLEEWANYDALAVPEVAFSTADGGAVRLKNPQPIVTDTHIILTSVWDVNDGTIPSFYSLAYHFSLADGTFLQSVDLGLADRTRGCDTRAVDIRDLPLETIDVQTTIYNWQTSDRLQTENEADNRPLLVQIRRR